MKNIENCRQHEETIKLIQLLSTLTPNNSFMKELLTELLPFRNVKFSAKFTNIFRKCKQAGLFRKNVDIMNNKCDISCH